MERRKLIIWEKANGYKAKDIAKALGITEQTYCNIKKGKSTPSIDFAYKLSEIFGVDDVLDLLQITQKNTQKK